MDRLLLRVFSHVETSLRLGTCLLAAVAVLASSQPSHAAVPVPGLISAGAVGQGFGTIKGKLVWGGADAPAPKILIDKGKAGKDPTVCATTANLVSGDLIVDPATKGVKNGFAYITKPSGSNPEAVKALLDKSPSVVVDQKNCEFLPYATALHQDQTITFKSSDPVNHNVHLSPFTNSPFNLILAPNGSVDKKLVAERRVIPLTCDIHPWMKGWIMVFDHPFFCVTGDDGSFEIKGVPAGDQNLVLWQPAVGYASKGLAQGMPVKVTSGSVTDVGEIKLDPAKVKP